MVTELGREGEMGLKKRRKKIVRDLKCFPKRIQMSKHGMALKVLEH